MIISLFWGNPNNLHPSITLLSSCISKPLIFPHQLNHWDQTVWFYLILGENKHKVCGEDAFLGTSPNINMHTCVTESQMEPCGATDIPIHGRRHNINQIPAVSENAQVIKTTNQSNHQCSKYHLTLISLLSVTVCVAIAAGITGFLVKYEKHAGES